MGFFPRIQSPCPYQGSLGEIMDGDVCRLCKKQVIDLTEMGDDGRRAFLNSCEGEVCVSYRLLRPALAAAVAGAAALATPALACDPPADPAATTAVPMDIIVTAGGMTAPREAEWVERRDVAAVPELPVTYEEVPAAADGQRDVASIKSVPGA